MTAGKPISLTQVDTGDYAGPKPKAYVVVGDIPVGDPVSLTAVPASFADEAAVRTYLATLVSELKSSSAFD